MVKSGILTHVFLALFCSFAFAGTTGKIVGYVKDASTKEPLPGANVIVKGTHLGASTAADGYFYILNVPPGTYTIEASMIGYKAQPKTNVKVIVDLTTAINFELTDQILMGEEVVIVAERPMIRRDETAKAAVIESETFSDMPIEEFEKALTTSAGFTTDEQGEIHIRGGRSGEAAYMIDGIYVRDPYSGGFGSQMDKYSIEELQIITGAFNAEYGQAMSGVINIITKEGGKQYHGRLETESTSFTESPYQKPDWMLSTDIAAGLPDDEKVLYQDTFRDSSGTSLYAPPDHSQKDNPGYMPFLGSVAANLQGPIPMLNKFSFFVSGRYFNTKGYLPFGYNKRREVNGKLTYSLKNIKFNLFLQWNLRAWKPYYHRWKYNPGGYEDRRSEVNRESLSLSHVLSRSTFYEVRVSRFRRTYNRFLPGKSATFVQNPETGKYELAETNFQRRRSNSDGFFFDGDNGTIDDRDILTYTAKVDMSSQINRSNLFKGGVEIISHTISRETFIQPWAGENHRYEKFTRHPFEFSAYVQDKIEHQVFVLNLGLRYDYSDPKHTMWPDLDVPGYIDADGNWIPSAEVPVEPKTRISPRLGVGFPVTDKTMFYSSYGHFYQIPTYLEMYGPHAVDEDQPLIGNPAIKPQKTVAFEVGLKQQIGTDYVLDLNVYFKDITNLAGSTYHGFFPFEYTLYDNSDYASVNGMDISLKKRFSYYFSAMVNYTFAVAKGNESDPREGFADFKRSNFPLRPKRLFYLDFDRRHDLSINAKIAFPKGFGPQLFGMKLFADLQFNLLFEAMSGLPYTPRLDDTGEGLLVEKNSAHRPPIYVLDLKLLKKLRFGQASLTGFLVVQNLFNRINPLRVWNRTGLPWDNGRYTSLSNDRVYDPSNVDNPRQFTLGIRFDF